MENTGRRKIQRSGGGPDPSHRKSVEGVLVGRGVYVIKAMGNSCMHRVGESSVS